MRKFKTYSQLHKIEQLERLTSSGMITPDDTRNLSNQIHEERMELMGVETVIPIYYQDPAITQALAKMKERKRQSDLERKIAKEQARSKNKRLRRTRKKASYGAKIEDVGIS
jgi:hypothetical protein